MLVTGQARGARFVRQVMVPMRDGVRLASTIFLPETDGRYPVVVERTPYNRLGHLTSGETWARNGYVYISQDTRGRYDSEGKFEPFLQEINDTPDTIAWIRQQPWCDGRVGQMGPSYLCWVQTLGVARGDGPLPDAILPTFAPCGTWKRGWYTGGPLSFFLSFWWLCFDAGSRVGNSEVMQSFDLPELYRRLPLRTLDVSCGAGESRVWREVMDHPTMDAFYDKCSIRDRFDKFTMPALHVCGWYDYYPAEMLANWKQMAALNPNHKIMIGPWGHHHGLEPTADGHRAVDFGPNSIYDYLKIYLSWFNRVFKGQPAPDGLGDRPLRLFVMGRNQWRDEDEWPLARTQFTNFYLHSAGRLSQTGPQTEPPDRYDYDPANPVPTHGGNHSIGPWSDSYKDFVWCGPCDQRPNEARPDVLCYTTEPLPADLEVTGPVTLKLWAASSARDTDFVGRLVDVYPDGRAINITEGIVRARYRNGDGAHPELIEPGAVLEYTLDLQVTSNVFLKGHAIRLEVTSSNFPLWDRNLNTGENPNTSTTMQVARQSIWHDATHPSHLVLPVIP